MKKVAPSVSPIWMYCHLRTGSVSLIHCHLAFMNILSAQILTDDRFEVNAWHIFLTGIIQLTGWKDSPRNGSNIRLGLECTEELDINGGLTRRKSVDTQVQGLCYDKYHIYRTRLQIRSLTNPYVSYLWKIVSRENFFLISDGGMSPLSKMWGLMTRSQNGDRNRLGGTYSNHNWLQ